METGREQAAETSAQAASSQAWSVWFPPHSMGSTAWDIWIARGARAGQAGSSPGVRSCPGTLHSQLFPGVHLEFTCSIDAMAKGSGRQFIYRARKGGFVCQVLLLLRPPPGAGKGSRKSGGFFHFLAGNGGEMLQKKKCISSERSTEQLNKVMLVVGHRLHSSCGWTEEAS